MGNTNWEKVEKLVDAVLDQPENQRLAYLEEHCSDPDLKTEVIEMLQSIDDSDGWLENLRGYRQQVFDQHFRVTSSLSSETLIGTQFGSYTIIEKIGEGGMGVIFLAERSDGTFNHRVAIKIIRNGRATEENIQRFKREQQILARLNHPGIAQLYDGGVTEEGFPYIIMEYVDGMPITEYCETHNCTIEKKIELIKMVLEAVQNAHENLTIHRDLKPDNILIDSSGKVKILDFGISKLLEDEDNLMLTQTGSKILTPRYAAPEQIKGTNITTATDMYSLGVVLYKLLTGIDPYDLDNKTRYEVEQTIIHDEPCKPSEAVRDPQLKRSLKGDLDAILLKSMRKEYGNRYRVASEFLEDLKNFEQGLPVGAHEGNFTYKTRKFIKRNKLPIIYSTISLAVLLFTMLYYTAQLRYERNIAKTEAQTANEVTDFLIELFEANSPGNSRGKEITARQLLTEGEKNIGNLSNQPKVQARLLGVLGTIYSLLNTLDKADSLKSLSVSLNKELYSEINPELASSYYSLAQTKHTLGEYKLTLSLLDTAITYQTELPEIDRIELAKSLRLKAETLKDLGNLDSAYAVIKRSQDIFKDQNAIQSRDYYRLLTELGAILSEEGRFKDAIETWNAAVDLSKSLFSPPHPDISGSYLGLAYTYKEMKEFNKAESLYKKVISMNMELYGENHLNTAVAINNLAGLYYYTKEYQKADSLFARSHNILSGILGEDHPSVISVLYNRANLNSDMGNYNEAESLYKLVLEFDVKTFGEYHQNVAFDHTGIAALLKRQEKYEEAEQHYLKSLEIRKKVYKNPDHPYIASDLRSLANLMVRTEQYTKADSLYRASIRSLIANYSPDHSEVKRTVSKYLEDAKLWGYSITPDSLISVLMQ